MLDYTWAKAHAALNDLPAALFLAAVLFDLAGWALKRETLRAVGFWSLWAEVVGGFLMLAWPFPLIALLLTLLVVSRRRTRPNAVLIASLLSAFAVVHLAWAGLHGSRLSMLGGMFLAARGDGTDARSVIA